MNKDIVKRIPCDCNYWEEPCLYCKIDPIISVNGNPILESKYLDKMK